MHHPLREALAKRLKHMRDLAPQPYDYRFPVGRGFACPPGLHRTDSAGEFVVLCVPSLALRVGGLARFESRRVDRRGVTR